MYTNTYVYFNVGSHIYEDRKHRRLHLQTHLHEYNYANVTITPSTQEEHNTKSILNLILTDLNIHFLSPHMVPQTNVKDPVLAKIYQKVERK